MLAWAIALGAAAPAHALPLRPLGAKGHLGNERLSNETTLTRFARPNRRTTIRATPGYHKRAVGKLHFYTEERYDEVYIALQTRRVNGESWVQIRIPGRPNGRKGWVPRWGLQAFRVVHTRLEINRHTLRAKLFDDGRVIWRSPVGVGKPGTPTPAGHFWIRERTKFGPAGGPYGPFAFGTANYSVLSDWPHGGVIGIHGTNQPSLIPGRPSHGCIRVPNAKIVKLAKLMPVGTPLVIY